MTLFFELEESLSLTKVGSVTGIGLILDARTASRPTGLATVSPSQLNFHFIIRYQ